MSSTPHGSAAIVPPSSTVRTVPESAQTQTPRFSAGAERRRAHDAAALESAQPEALRAARAVVAALESRSDAATLAAISRDALSALAVLWETAARVSDP